MAVASKAVTLSRERFFACSKITGNNKRAMPKNVIINIAIVVTEDNVLLNLIFFKSPIGKALIGKNKGDMVTVSTPSGERNFEILDVEYV